MIEPRRVIDPIRYLPKENEIVYPQFELSLWPAEIKSTFRLKFTFRVFAAMAATLGKTRGRAQPEWGNIALAVPDQNLAGLSRRVSHWGKRLPYRFSKLLDNS